MTAKMEKVQEEPMMSSIVGNMRVTSRLKAKLVTTATEIALPLGSVDRSERNAGGYTAQATCRGGGGVLVFNCHDTTLGWEETRQKRTPLGMSS